MKRALLLVLAMGLSAVGAAATPCPDLYLLRGDASEDGAFDVVFFPSGFDSTELPLFRCAVDRLLEVFHEDPFVRGACRFNVFRGDLESGSSGFGASSCSSPCDPPQWNGACGNLDAYAAPNGTKVSRSLEPTRNAAAPAVRCCWTGGGTGDDISITANAQLEFIGMAECARGKPADAVVVVANATGNLAAYYGSDLPVIVVSLDGISATGAVARLAHELGHALRLLDETDLPYGPFDETLLPTFLCDRNVALIAPQGGEDPALISCVGSVPWEAACTSTPTSAPPESCASKIGSCVQSRNVSGGCADCAAPNEAIGLVEGAFYHSCGYYRPTPECRMWNYGKPFCRVCGDLAKTEIDLYDAALSCLDTGTHSYLIRREAVLERVADGPWFTRPTFPPPILLPPRPPRPDPPPGPLRPPPPAARKVSLDGLPVMIFEAEEDLGGLRVSVNISRLDIEWLGAEGRISTIAVEPGFPYPRLKTNGPLPFDAPVESARFEATVRLEGVHRLIATEAHTRRKFEPLRVTIRAPDREVPVESRP